MGSSLKGLINAACDSDDDLRAVTTREHASACVTIRQHASAYVSIRQQTSATIESRSVKGSRVQVRGEARGEAGESKCVRE